MSDQDHDFEIDVDTRETGVVVHLRGVVEGDHAPRLIQELMRLLEDSPRRVVLDLAQMGFINSEGLGGLVSFYNRLTERGGELRLAAANDQIASVLETTHLNQLFPVFGDTESAIGE